MSREDLLFLNVDAFAVQEHQRKKLESDVASLDSNRLPQRRYQPE